MEVQRDKARLSGKKAGQSSTHSPQNHSNMVINTSSMQKAARQHETDLQKAITDYQAKVNKQKSGKSKH